MVVCRRGVAVVVGGEGTSEEPDTPTSEGSADYR